MEHSLGRDMSYSASRNLQKKGKCQSSAGGRRRPVCRGGPFTDTTTTLKRIVDMAPANKKGSLRTRLGKGRFRAWGMAYPGPDDTGVVMVLGWSW